VPSGVWLRILLNIAEGHCASRTELSGSCRDGTYATQCRKIHPPRRGGPAWPPVRPAMAGHSGRPRKGRPHGAFGFFTCAQLSGGRLGVRASLVFGLWAPTARAG